MPGVKSWRKFISNLSGKVRYEQLEGRDYIVAPMVMITEGVHEGNGGPIFYPEEELSDTPEAWDHKPVVVYHPNIDGGDSNTACDPIFLNSRKTGIILNTQWDAPKLKAEAWLEASRIPVVDDRIMKFLENNQKMEVSTGMYAYEEATEGVWNGKPYKGIARNIRGDHLALLPDKKGACSIEDGAGLLQNSRRLVRKMKSSGLLICNEMTHSDIRNELFQRIRERYDDAWIEDVFDGNFVFSRLDKYYSLGYTKAKSGVTIANDDPKKVRRSTNYIPISNSKGKKMPKPKTKEFDKEKAVEGLITNSATKWEESDRAWLTNLSEEQLQKLMPDIEPKKTEEEVIPPSIPANTAPPADSPAAPVLNQGQNKEMTMEEYLAAAPPAFREVIQNGMTAHNEKKAEFIKKILANSRNRFTEDQLKGKQLGELQAIAELAIEPQSSRIDNAEYPSYVGVAGSQLLENEAGEFSAYEAPDWGWGKN